MSKMRFKECFKKKGNYLLLGSFLVLVLVVVELYSSRPTEQKTGALNYKPYSPAQGGLGTSTPPSYGNVPVGNAQGTYTLTATSSLGISAAPGGMDTQVQFNDSGAFGGSSDFTWDKNNLILTIGGSDTGSVRGGISGDFPSPLTFETLAGLGSDAHGGNYTMLSGDGFGAGSGGQYHMSSGNGGGTGDGGVFNISAGNGGITSGAGGSISLTAGSAQGGDSNGGDFALFAGAPSGIGHQGSFFLATYDLGAVLEMGSFSGDEPPNTLGIKSSGSFGFVFLNTSLLTSTDRTLSFLDQTGTTTVKTDTATLTGQTADIGSTSFSATAVGLYRVSYYVVDTAADLTAGAVTLHVAYTDPAASQTQNSAAVLLTTLGGFAQGTMVLQLGSGAVSYSTTHSGSFGTAAYDVYMTLERMN